MHRSKGTTIAFDIELHTQTTADQPELALLVAVETPSQAWAAQDLSLIHI